MKSSILIVDDHQLVLDGLVSIVNDLEHFDVISTAHNGEEALAQIKSLKPELVLMDIDMPIMNGLEATTEIKRLSNAPKVMILSMHNESALIKKVMEIGADGYLLKNADRQEFEVALEKIKMGKSYFSPEVTEALLNPNSAKETFIEATSGDIEKYGLTEREIEVLSLIAEGYSNKEIGDELFISHRTVDTHRTNLMRKLEVHNIAGLIKFALKHRLTG